MMLRALSSAAVPAAARLLSGVLVAGALLAGCIPPTFPEDALPAYEERPVEATFDATKGALWEATVEVLSDLYPLDVIDKERGLISTEWVVGASDYIFNVYSGTRIPEKVRFRMTIDVGDKSGRGLVRVRNHEQVEKDIISANLEFTGSIYEWIDVPTSSRKERDALERIAARLEKGRGKAKADVDLRD